MAGVSADIELVRPAFTPGETPGVEAPRYGEGGTVTAGALVQYEQQPLVLYRYGDEDTSVIEARFAGALGASIDFTRHLGARLVLPMAYDVAGSAGDFAAGGFGSGDLVAGMRVLVWRWGPVDLGAHADLLLPVGATDAWKGEGSLRGQPGVLLALNAGPFSVRSDTSFMLRQAVDTGADFTLGTELGENAAVRGTLWEDRLWLHAGVASRIGLGETDGTAERVAEVLVGAQVSPHREWTLDFGLGRGLTSGYGTSRLRVMAGVTFSRAPRAAVPEPVIAVMPSVEDIPDAVLIEQIALPPPEKTWQATELARVEQDQIVIRDPIQFEFAKDVILPVSLPTLRFVGGLLNEHPEIMHLVIEGHASEEGSYYYNYDLAKRRADAIWRALVEAGVSPTRISTRSMGEVEPVASGSAEDELALNRRVIFHIVRRLEPGEIPPQYKLDIQQPWTGSAQTLPAPPPVALPPPPEPPKPSYTPPPDDLPSEDEFEEDDE